MKADATPRLKGTLPKLFLAVGLTLAAGIFVYLLSTTHVIVILSDRERETLSIVLALGVTVWAFSLLLLYLRSLKWQPFLVVSSLALFYVGCEHFLAPHLMRPLKMRNYYYVRNPDHWDEFKIPPKGQNADLIRCRWEAEDFQEDGLNVVFLGDSFTFGSKLKAEEAFPHIVTDMLRAEFPNEDLKGANFGWESSSPLLSLRKLEAIGDKYNPKVVALFLDMTDFQDDIKYANMLEQNGIYWYLYHFPIAMHYLKQWSPDTFWDFYWKHNQDMPRKRFFVTEQPLEQSLPYLEPIVKNIDGIYDWCEKRGATFLLYVLPRSYQVNDKECPNNWEKDEYAILGPHSLIPFEYFYSRRNDVGYPIYLNLLKTFQNTEVFPVCFDFDPHWNPAGSRVAAEGIFPGMKMAVEQVIKAR